MIPKIVAAVVFALVPAAFAQTYIVPDSECGSVTFHVTSGNDFPNLGAAGPAIARGYVHLPNQRIEVKPAAAARSFDFTAEVPGDGIVMAAVDLEPAVIGNETHTDHAKAFVRCGAIAKRDDWQVSTGIGLEIFPQWNGLMPLKPGQMMDFIVVDQPANKLLCNVPMDLYLAGAGLVATATPLEGGFVRFPYKQPGRYMVVATYRRPDPKNEGRWLSDTSTLTLEMK